jgi:hypothetical protein
LLETEKQLFSIINDYSTQPEIDDNQDTEDCLDNLEDEIIDSFQYSSALNPGAEDMFFGTKSSELK